MSHYALPNYDAFVRALTPWFETTQFPVTLRRQLYEKLEGRVFDSGDSFALIKIAADSASNEEEWETDTEPALREPEAQTDGDEQDAGAARHSERASGAAHVEREGANIEEEAIAVMPGHVLLAKRDLCAGADVWLVDHAITFSNLDELAYNLAQNESLCDRVEELVRLPPLATAAADASTAESEPPVPSVQQRQAERVRRILSHMWKSVLSYSLPRAQGESPLVCWYFTDEVGSAVTPYTEDELSRADDPTPTPLVRLEVLPLSLPPNGLVFSVMWCVTDVPQNALVVRKAAYHPCWSTVGTIDKHARLDEPTCVQVLTEVLYGSDDSRRYAEAVEACIMLHSKAPEAVVSRRSTDGGLSADAATPVFTNAPRPSPLTVVAETAGRVKIYSDNSAISHALHAEAGVRTGERGLRAFEVVTTPSAADCVWLTHASALTRFAGGPGSTKRAFPNAKCLSSFPSLDARLATPATWAAWLRDHVEPRADIVDAMPIVYKGTAADLCLLVGDFLLRELYLVAAHGKEPNALVACASKFVSTWEIEHTRALDSVNAWYAYALPHPTALSLGSGGGDAEGRPLVESSDVPALLKLAEPRPMVYVKHIVNTVRLPDFAARHVTVKVFLVVRAVGTAASTADVSVYNYCAAVLKPDVVGSQRLVEDATQVSQTLAGLTTPYKFVGAGAPARQSLWLPAAALETRLCELFGAPSAWVAAQSQMLTVLRAVVPPLVTAAQDTVVPRSSPLAVPETLAEDEMQRRRAILCATFFLAHDKKRVCVQPVLVNMRNGTDYAALSHVYPSAVPDLFRAALLGDQTNTTPL